MRKTREKQRPLSPPWPDHQLANELKVISRILDDNPQTLELIVQDLSDRVDSSVGAPGLTAEQVLRCAVIKQLHQFSYRKLEFHLVDSQLSEVLSLALWGVDQQSHPGGEPGED